MPRRASAAPAAAPAPAAIPEKHELPKKPKPPKQVKDAAENERRAAVHAAALKDWEQQMAEHAERMATRKKAQKDASRPADDSERRVKQRRESWTQAETDAAGADDRRTAKRLEAQRVRVRQAQVDLIHALRSCITNYSDDKLYAQARRDLGRIVYQLHYEQSADGTAGIQNGNPPDGTVDWDAEFDAAADAAPRANVCLEASLPRSAPLRQRPALELFQVEWLLADGDGASGWDESLNAYPLADGSSAVTGRAVIDFLHRERRKGLAEAAFETHLQAVFDRQGRSCNRGDSLRDADSVWWREALGPQHKRYGRVSRFATEKEKAEFAAGLCRCGMRVCRCPIGCVVDMDGSPVEPRQFAMSEDC